MLHVISGRFLSVLPQRLALAVGLVAAACGMSGALAQTYPSRTVTIVVPFPPGGGPDLFARTVAERLTPRLGQTFIVENRPGVGGLAGAGMVAKAPADGHMLLVAPSTLVIAPHVVARGAGGGVDVMKDLVPVILPASTPMALVVHPSLGVKSVAELVALAKRQPGLPYASAGNGSPMHIAGELFKKAAGVDMLHVPYKGAGPAVTDVIAGQVKVLYVGLGGVSQHIRAGKLVPIALTERRRSAVMPGLATMEEQGYKGVEVDAWYGMLAPAGTPAAVIALLNREINQVIAIPEVKERMLAAGIEMQGGPPERLGAEMREDHARYGRIIQEFGIKAD